ncbi:MAG: indole-3-glycerol phosphate synthase TrpC [Clostridia bacterium]|nr:indole-3-glycerol phosphate synthase TrpC [Clostridia bacterium]
MNILDRIAEATRERVRQERARCSLESLKELARVRTDGLFQRAIEKPGLSLICEVKKASPSRGIIDPEFNYRAIAADYAAGGADAISCLTEPEWFLGSDQIFREIRALVPTPMLRKDFVVDAYQIWQASVMGADAVLLICALLDAGTLAHYLDLCHGLGLSALVETHDTAEIAMAVSAGAKIIGVNNRNLRDFTVDLGNAARLRDCIPTECLYVSESGVRSPEDAAAMKEAGADAILVGEALMRAGDRQAMIEALRDGHG